MHTASKFLSEDAKTVNYAVGTNLVVFRREVRESLSVIK